MTRKRHSIADEMKAEYVDIAKLGGMIAALWVPDLVTVNDVLVTLADGT